MTLKRFRSSRTRWPLQAEDGFSIIEVMAAFTVLAIVTLGTVPLFISGLRASLVSKLDTAGKNLSQERFEAMRNLPFYVSSSLAAPAASCTTPGVNTAGCDYKDLLDTYYRSAQAALSNAVGGYVATNGGRSADEVEAGIAAPFYRYIQNPVPNFQDGKFSVVIATQFLDVTSANPRANPLAPPADYNTQDSDLDFPRSRFVGVTVISRWTAGNLTKKFISFSQISEGPPDSTLVALQAQATALRLRTALRPPPTEELLNMDVGVSNSDGLYSNGASTATGARGAFASIVPGSAIDGANGIASAPPVSTSGTGLVPAQSLNYAPFISEPAASFASTNVDDVTAAIVSDQPSVPAANPGTDLSLGELLRKGSSDASNDLTFTNGTALSAPPELSLTPPMVLSKEGGGGRSGFGSTYLKSAAGTSHFVESGAQAEMQTIQILPTTFASKGVVQVKLVSAQIVCKTTGLSSAGTAASFEVHVSHILPGETLYKTYRFTQAGALDGPLPNLSTTLVSILPPFFLSGWVRDWNVLTGASTVISSPPKSVSSTLNGIFSLTTANTRTGDDSSAILVMVGHLSCVAEDNR